MCQCLEIFKKKLEFYEKKIIFKFILFLIYFMLRTFLKLAYSFLSFLFWVCAVNENESFRRIAMKDKLELILNERVIKYVNGIY